MEYEHDDYGQRTKMHTFRDKDGTYTWTGSTWPNPSSTDADTTTWEYDPDSGLLEKKTDAEGEFTEYTYTTEGHLDTRTWARLDGGNALVTTYGYDPDTGELLTVDYSNFTADVTFTYDRLGRRKTVTDIVGTRTFGYNDTTLQLETEDIVAGANGLYSKLITRDYDSSGRNAGFHVGSTTPYEYELDYTYDTKGRLDTVDGPGLPGPADYARVSNSELLKKIELGSADEKVEYTYDPKRDLMAAVTNTIDSAPVSKYTYEYDSLGRRQSVVNEEAAFPSGGEFNIYQYNERSELTDSTRYSGNDITPPLPTPITGQDFDYRYENIGNRKTYAIDGANPPTAYDTSDVNEYTGTTDPLESFTYDEDGNMTGDGTMTYTWDGENRLATAFATTPVLDDHLVVNSYDYMNRRVQKIAYKHNGTTWVLESFERYVYEGWNVVLVLDGLNNNAVLRKYTWGLDVSGTIHGAGGVGGLLAVEDDGDAYVFVYDANGNVGQVVDTSTWNTVAEYEYDPYGSEIRAAGTYAAANPIRFSTKWYDVETQLYMYPRRPYSPCPGRWLSRDPIGDSGGVNLYAFVRNNPTQWIDPIGTEPTPLQANPFLCCGEGCLGYPELVLEQA